MIRFNLHTVESAPPEAQGLLRSVRTAFGFLPNLFAKLAESATALRAYLELRAHFERSSLTPEEQQVVALAVCVENESPFCTSAHTHAARHFTRLPEAVIEALRDNRELPDPKLNVLADFTRELVRKRGQVDDGDLNVFLAAGYSMRQMLDVILGVALKTFTNHVSHVVRAPLNEEFESERWTPPLHVRRSGWRPPIDLGGTWPAKH